MVLDGNIGRQCFSLYLRLRLGLCDNNGGVHSSQGASLHGAHSFISFKGGMAMGEENKPTRVGRFDVKPCDIAVDLTDGRRFTKLKLTRDQRMQMNALPGAALSLLGVNTLPQLYMLSFLEGVQGTLMWLKQGRYNTALQNPETGQIVGTAALG